MTEEQAKKLLREIAKTGWVRFTTHCRERMKQRNVHADDFLQCLLWGELKELKENPEAQNWECLVAGRDLEGDPLTIKVAILEADFAVVCITAHG